MGRFLVLEEHPVPISIIDPLAGRCRFQKAIQ